MSNGITTASGDEVEEGRKGVERVTLEDKRDRGRGGSTERSTWKTPDQDKWPLEEAVVTYYFHLQGPRQRNRTLFLLDYHGNEGAIQEQKAPFCGGKKLPIGTVRRFLFLFLSSSLQWPNPPHTGFSQRCSIPLLRLDGPEVLGEEPPNNPPTQPSNAIRPAHTHNPTTTTTTTGTTTSSSAGQGDSRSVGPFVEVPRSGLIHSVGAAALQ
ncbi:unnamed protein product [Pleuronectes platessa]|uniref:Uncharacterized protein n=1 Tax=Pleuronectes platessa TaxID=8262 RepID=A0A9N7VIE9_PLEPL|nr:unnamed protein product [Pleuronectes platessa]